MDSSLKAQIRKEQDLHLLDAAHAGDLEKFKKAYANGADVNARNQWGETPLHLATMNKHRDIIDYIFFINKAGLPVELNAITNSKYTALMFATIGKDAETVLKLLPHLNSSQLMSKDMCGCTAFMWAAQNGELFILTSMISILNDIEIIAHLEAIDEFNFTALMLAAQHNHTEAVAIIVEYLIKYNKREILNNQNIWRQTAANLAAEKGHINVCEILKAAGADFTLPDLNQKTVSMYLEQHALGITVNELDEGDLLAEHLNNLSFSSVYSSAPKAVTFSNSVLPETLETKQANENNNAKRKSGIEEEIQHKVKKMPVKKIRQNANNKPKRKTRQEYDYDKGANQRVKMGFM